MQLLEATTRIWSHCLSVRTAVYAAATHGSVECQSSHHRSFPDGFHAGLMATLQTAELFNITYTHTHYLLPK